MHPQPGSLWRMAEQYQVSVFGTSARYLAAVMDAGVVPKRDYDLSALRCILSTGSPSTHSTYEYVYGSIKENVQFASISGGTDINGCFCCGCPVLPVYDSELSERSESCAAVPCVAASMAAIRRCSALSARLFRAPFL